MICCNTCKKKHLLDKINLNKFIYEYALFLKEKKKSDLLCKVEKNGTWLTKNHMCFVMDKKKMGFG